MRLSYLMLLWVLVVAAVFCAAEPIPTKNVSPPTTVASCHGLTCTG